MSSLGGVHLISGIARYDLYVQGSLFKCEIYNIITMKLFALSFCVVCFTDQVTATYPTCVGFARV